MQTTDGHHQPREKETTPTSKVSLECRSVQTLHNVGMVSGLTDLQKAYLAHTNRPGSRSKTRIRRTITGKVSVQFHHESRDYYWDKSEWRNADNYYMRHILRNFKSAEVEALAKTFSMVGITVFQSKSTK